MARVRTSVTRGNKGSTAQLMRAYQNALKIGVQRAAVMVHATAVQSITSGGKSGATYEKYNPRRTHRASAAGEPPAADTGYLHNNIIFDIDTNGLGADIESRAEYSGMLEFGTSKMQARPFLQPAIEENRPKIRRLMVNAMRGAR
jgi:HK97 gp10 family phage protein